MPQIVLEIMQLRLTEIIRRDNWKVSYLRWWFHTLFGLKKLICPASGYLNPLNFESFLFYQSLEQTYANIQQLTSEVCRNCPHLETKVNHSLRIESILSLAQGIFNASLRWSYLIHVTAQAHPRILWTSKLSQRASYALSIVSLLHCLCYEVLCPRWVVLVKTGSSRSPYPPYQSLSKSQWQLFTHSHIFRKVRLYAHTIDFVVGSAEYMHTP